MTLKAILVTALAIGALQPMAAFADSIPPEFQNRGCVVFPDANGQGFSYRVNVRDRQEINGSVYYAFYQPTMSALHNNSISAVQCDHHCNAVLYDQQHMTNPELALVDGQQGFVSFAGQYADDKASSLSVFCSR